MARKPATNTESAPATEEENLESPTESTEEQIETKEAIAPEESPPVETEAEESVTETKEESVVTEEPTVPRETILPEEPVVIDEITLPPEETPPDEDPITQEVPEETDANVDPGKGLVQATIDNLPRDEQELLMAAILDFQKSGLPRDTIASIIINTFFDKVIAQEPESKETLVAISNRIVEVSQHDIFQSFVGELEGILSSGLEPASKLSVLSGSLDTLAGKLG